jgi:hypothetical protein
MEIELTSSGRTLVVPVRARVRARELLVPFLAIFGIVVGLLLAAGLVAVAVIHFHKLVPATVGPIVGLLLRGLVTTRSSPPSPRPPTILRPSYVRITRSALELMHSSGPTETIQLAQITHVLVTRSGGLVVRTAARTIRFVPLSPWSASALARRIEIRSRIALRTPKPSHVIAVALEALAITGAEAVLLQRGRFIGTMSLAEARLHRGGSKRRVFARRPPEVSAPFASPYRTAAFPGDGVGEVTVVDPV